MPRYMVYLRRIESRYQSVEADNPDAAIAKALTKSVVPAAECGSLWWMPYQRDAYEVEVVEIK